MDTQGPGESVHGGVSNAQPYLVDQAKNQQSVNFQLQNKLEDDLVVYWPDRCIDSVFVGSVSIFQEVLS